MKISIICFASLILVIASLFLYIQVTSKEKEENHFSQRLSYNELMGVIMVSLNEKGYDVAVQGDIISDKNVVITLVLPHDKFDEVSKKEAQQLATDVIIKNNFEIEIFQFNLTSYYKS